MTASPDHAPPLGDPHLAKTCDRIRPLTVARDSGLAGREDLLQRPPVDEIRPSWQSRLIIGLLRFLRVKRRFASAASVQDDIRKTRLNPVSHAPKGLGRGVTVTKRAMAGWPVYHTMPARGTPAGDVVLFLHGGAYIDEIVRSHWRFVGILTRRAGQHCVVPIYPLAPQGTAAEVVPTTGMLLRRLLEDAGSAKVTVIGNSAGAGLALAAAQWLRDHAGRQPSRLILISPELDASFSRPEQPALASGDPVLDIPGLQEAARLYAGALGLDHPFVSPLNGDFRGLAPMTVFAGTLDLLYPDSIALAAKALAADVQAEFHLRRGQPHNFALMPTPEGQQARERILRDLA